MLLRCGAEKERGNMQPGCGRKHLKDNTFLFFFLLFYLTILKLGDPAALINKVIFFYFFKDLWFWVGSCQKRQKTTSANAASANP